MSAYCSNGTGGVVVCRPEQAADHIARLRRRGHMVRIETPTKDEVKLYWGSMAPKPQPPSDRFLQIMADIEAGKYSPRP